VRGGNGKCGIVRFFAGVPDTVCPSAISPFLRFSRSLVLSQNRLKQLRSITQIIPALLKSCFPSAKNDRKFAPHPGCSEGNLVDYSIVACS
jgi:hypothetical protein